MTNRTKRIKPMPAMKIRWALPLKKSTADDLDFALTVAIGYSIQTRVCILWFMGRASIDPVNAPIPIANGFPQPAWGRALFAKARPGDFRSPGYGWSVLMCKWLIQNE